MEPACLTADEFNAIAQSLRVKDLAAILRELRLPYSGTKGVLQQRLRDVRQVRLRWPALPCRCTTRDSPCSFGFNSRPASPDPQQALELGRESSVRLVDRAICIEARERVDPAVAARILQASRPPQAAPSAGIPGAAAAATAVPPPPAPATAVAVAAPSLYPPPPHQAIGFAPPRVPYVARDDPRSKLPLLREQDALSTVEVVIDGPFLLNAMEYRFIRRFLLTDTAMRRVRQEGLRLQLRSIRMDIESHITTWPVHSDVVVNSLSLPVKTVRRRRHARCTHVRLSQRTHTCHALAPPLPAARPPPTHHALHTLAFTLPPGHLPPTAQSRYKHSDEPKNSETPLDLTAHVAAGFNMIIFTCSAEPKVCRHRRGLVGAGLVATVGVGRGAITFGSLRPEAGNVCGGGGAAGLRRARPLPVCACMSGNMGAHSPAATPAGAKLAPLTPALPTLPTTLSLPPSGRRSLFAWSSCDRDPSPRCAHCCSAAR